MSYIRAEEVLPEDLLRQVQRYVDGAYIYVPRKPGTRRLWGQGTAYKKELEHRNRMICKDRTKGFSIPQLARKYHLSERSIHRILRE